MSITTPSLIESMLLHDRPAAWWGLDTADPLADDAVFGTSRLGYTLTVNGTPANAASLYPRGDTGASGCRDFDGVDDAYWTLGKVTRTADGPPRLHGMNSSTATSATGTVVSPGGVEVGDLLIFIAVHTTNGATVTTAPAGYTNDGTVVSVGNHTRVIYRKTAVLADTVPGEVSIVWNSSADIATMILAIRGCDPDVANLIFDQGGSSTASDTYHVSSTESFPEQSIFMVIWTKDYSGLVEGFPTGRKEWGSVANGDLGIDVFAYHNEEAGSRFVSATTSAATTLGTKAMTFGSPEKVLNDSLDTLGFPVTFHAVLNADTFDAAGFRSVLTRTLAFAFQFFAGQLLFSYNDGSWNQHNGPTLSTGTTYRIWIRDDGETISFFVNGTKTDVARATIGNYEQPAGSRFVVGCYWDGANFIQDWDGRIDEVAIFEAALTDEQILAHEIAARDGTFGDVIQADKSGRFPRAKLEMAINSKPTDPCFAFTDITDDVRHATGLRLGYGRNSELDRMQAGTMDFELDNRDRAYNGLNPTRVVRFRAQVATDGPVYSRFFGFTDGPKYLRGANGTDATVALTATDLFKSLAVDKVRTTLVRPNELPGARLQGLLEDLPNLRYLVDAGHHLIISADLQGNGRLEHAQLVAETDGGLLFASPDGVLVFQDNQYRSVKSRTVQQTFGWVGTSAPMRCQSFEPEVDETRLFTAAMVTPASGNVQIAVNAAATASFFERTRELTTLHAVDIDALAMAHHYANVYSEPVERVPALRLQPVSMGSVAASQAMWSAIFGLAISDRIKTIEKPPPTTAAEFSREHFIEGVSEQINANDWVVDFQLSPILEGDLFVIGTSLIVPDPETASISGGDDVIGW